MAWIEVHQSLPTHKKLKKFKRALGLKTTSEALGKLVMLWLWALDNAPDGNLSDIFPDDIAEAADARSGEEIIDALKSAGFLDENMQLHDWCDYAGTLITQRENRKAANRERQKRYYDSHFKKPNAEPNALGNVRLTDSNARPNALDLTPPNGSSQTHPNVSTVPHRTPPYQTVPDHLSPQTPQERENGEREIPRPSFAEVEEYAKTIGLTVDARRFVLANELNGWKDSNGNPIRDWHTWLQGYVLRNPTAKRDTLTAPDPRIAELERLKVKYEEEGQ